MKKIFNDEMVQVVDYSSFLYHLQGDYDEEDKNNEIRIKKNVSLKKWKNAMKKLFLMNLQMETYNLEEHFQRLILQQSVTKLYFIL